MTASSSSGRVRVLVPLDGSDFARQVIPYLIDVLRPTSHALTLLRVAPVPEGHHPVPPRPLAFEGWSAQHGWRGQEPPVYYSQVYEGAVANLEVELLDEARRLAAAGFDVTSEVRFGEAVPEIVAVVEAGGVDMVVMATHGRSGVSRLLLGSVARAVLENVHVPVMMVRPRATLAGEGLPAQETALGVTTGEAPA